jgi:hypothetical protein
VYKATNDDIVLEDGKLNEDGMQRETKKIKIKTMKPPKKKGTK